MNDTVTIPRAEYDRLCALAEEFMDIQAALAVEARIASGEEELIPAQVLTGSSTGNRRYASGGNTGDSLNLPWRVSPASTGCRSSRLKRAAIAGRCTPCASWPTRCGSRWMTSSPRDKGA